MAIADLRVLPEGSKNMALGGEEIYLPEEKELEERRLRFFLYNQGDRDDSEEICERDSWAFSGALFSFTPTLFSGIIISTEMPFGLYDFPSSITLIFFEIKRG